MSNLITIESRKLGTEFNFEQRGTYLYVNGNQLCQHGRYMGETLSCGRGDIVTAVKLCKSWYSQMMRKQRIFG